jgi:hypothetical protein
MSTVYGQTEWNAEDGMKAGGNRTTSDFMHLEEGDNIIRVVTLPYIYMSHSYMFEGGPKWGSKVNCSRIEKDGRVIQECTLCSTGNKAKKRWMMGVLDRKVGGYKILDVTWAVYGTIKTLATSAWGTPDKYDILIKKVKNGGPTGTYTVLNQPPVPLTASDLKLMESIDRESLVRLTTPPTPEKVMERMEKLQGQPMMAPAMRQAPAPAIADKKVARKAPVQVKQAVEEEDEDFPSYDA